MDVTPVQISQVTSWTNFIDIVRQDKSINFVAMAVTQWNALSIDALVFYLESKGYVINAGIVIAEHYSSGYLIDETFFTNKSSRYYLLPYSKEADRVFESKPEKDWTEKLQRACDFYRIVFDFKNNWSKHPLFYSTFNHTIPDAVILQQLGDMGRPVVVCRTEEGIGPYMGTFDKTYPRFREVRTLPALHGYMRAVFWGREVYGMLHKSYDSLTMKKAWHGLRKNDSIIPFYRKVFALRNEMVKPVVDKRLINNSVIICTASWKRHLIQDEEDFRVLKLVCDDLHNRGIKLLLKAHPRDAFYPTKFEELHCELLNVPGLSFEGLCECALPKAVISYPSTTLINPKLFWNVPTFCVADMLDREKMRNYIDEIDSFKRVFRNFVRFVKTPNEIKI